MKWIVILILSLVFVYGCANQQVQNSAEVTILDVGQEGDDIEVVTTNAAGSVKEFDVVIGHTFYRPDDFVVKRGDTVRFSAVVAAGTGNHNHGITIDEYGINQAVTSESEAVVVEFAADKSGTFSIWCKTCWEGPFGRGHPDIRATLTVEE